MQIRSGDIGNVDAPDTKIVMSCRPDPYRNRGARS
jgi:hypothetical protein